MKVDFSLSLSPEDQGQLLEWWCAMANATVERLTQRNGGKDGGRSVLWIGCVNVVWNLDFQNFTLHCSFHILVASCLRQCKFTACLEVGVEAKGFMSVASFQSVSFNHDRRLSGKSRPLWPSFPCWTSRLAGGKVKFHISFVWIYRSSMMFWCKGMAMTGTKRFFPWKFFPWMHPCDFDREAMHFWFVDLHRSSCRGGSRKFFPWNGPEWFRFKCCIATRVEETPLVYAYWVTSPAGALRMGWEWS